MWNPQAEPWKRPQPRQLEIASLHADGLTCQEIADQLGIRVNTVYKQMRRLYRDLGADNMAHAYRICLAYGHIRLE